MVLKRQVEAAGQQQLFDVSSTIQFAYHYPQPNDAILSNILNALANVPGFYVQVLNLMNSMNLPPPFSSSANIPTTIQYNRLRLLASGDDNDQESESVTEHQSLSGQKRQRDLQQELARKQLLPLTKKRRILQGSTTHSAENPRPSYTVGSTSETEEEEDEDSSMIDLVSKEKQKTKTDMDGTSGKLLKDQQELSLLIQTISSEGSASSNVQPEVVCPFSTDEESKTKTLIDLECGRFSDDQLKEKFPSHSFGSPSTKLYVKNISKSVKLEDLHRIFSIFVGGPEENQKSLFPSLS